MIGRLSIKIVDPSGTPSTIASGGWGGGHNKILYKSNTAFYLRSFNIYKNNLQKKESLSEKQNRYYVIWNCSSVFLYFVCQVNRNLLFAHSQFFFKSRSTATSFLKNLWKKARKQRQLFCDMLRSLKSVGIYATLHGWQNYVIAFWILSLYGKCLCLYEILTISMACKFPKCLLHWQN